MGYSDGVCKICNVMIQVSSKEAEFLQKILPSYYNNLQQNPKTLLIKYNGMYAYQVKIDTPLKDQIS